MLAAENASIGAAVFPYDTWNLPKAALLALQTLKMALICHPCLAPIKKSGDDFCIVDQDFGFHPQISVNKDLMEQLGKGCTGTVESMFNLHTKIGCLGEVTTKLVTTLGFWKDVFSKRKETVQKNSSKNLLGNGEEGVYNEVVSLLGYMDGQDKDKIALRIAHIAETKLAIVVTLLLEKLQQDEKNRVDIYCVLEKVLRQDTEGLERRLLSKIITLASNHMRETQAVTDELKVAASNTLVTLARCYFNEVMYELQCCLKPLELPEEFTFITLGNLSSAYALKCIPFVGMTLNVMSSMLQLAKDSRMKQALCGVLEKFSRAVNVYFSNWEKCPFPRMGEAQFCDKILPFYCHVTSNWLTCKELELKQVIIKALGPMMSLLLHKEEQQDQIFEQISWLLEQYKEDIDAFHVTKSLSQLLEVSGAYKIPLPKGKFQAICSALHHQICSQAKQLSMENHVELFYCILLLAHSSPDDLIAFLHSQLKIENETVRVASLNLLRAIVSADMPETRVKKFLIVKAVKSTLNDQSTKVRNAVLHFIRRLLSSGSVENCAAWDMVAYVFNEFSVSTSKLQKTNLSTQDAQEESAIQTMCIDILQCLDTSVSGMTQVLWPRLLEYVVPAQYTGTLKPLCRCLRELAEKKQQEGEEAACLDYTKLPTPQGLLARLLVVASSPYEREGHGCDALQLLKTLHQNIHAAVGETWTVKIPSLLQYIEGNTENSLDHAQWERILLQFLRTSLEMIDDSAWTSQLSLALNQQMAGYATPSKEKSFLYKALGTSLAVCQDLVHVKSQIQKFLKTTDYMEAPERQGIISILAFSAESHLDLTLNTLQEFGAAMNKVKISGFIGRLKDYHHGKRGKTRSTLMLTYSSVAVHAPKDQLFSRVEADITGNILHHYRTSCQVLGISVANKDMYLKLTLIQSATEISCAILETKDSQAFEFSYKLELLGHMLDFIQKEPLDSLASPVRYKAILAIGHLSKLKPSLTLEENRDLLDQCLKSLFPLPPLEQMKEEGETAKDALHIQLLYEWSLEALGELMKILLEEAPTPDWFQEMFHLLETWFSSGKEWERERALQASIQLLTAYQETVNSTTQENFDQFGSLIGLLAPYSCDSLATSRQWVADCISCLLHIQGQSMNLGSAEEELRCLREALTASDSEALFQASSKMAKVVSEYFPSEQATDFIEAILDGMLSTSPTCATAAGLWMKTILKECGNTMLDEVPDILGIIYIRMPTVQQGSLRQFLVEAVSILAHHHLEAVISSLLSKCLPMDSDTTELWRSLGGDSLFTTQVLQILTDKIKNPTSQEGSINSETETDRQLAAAEPLTATCAIFEVVSALQSSKAVQELLPELFAVLLQQVSRTLGQEMPLPKMSSRRRLFRKGQQLCVGDPCRLSIEALESVLFKGVNERLVRTLRNQRTWVLLENPETHHEGVCLLVSVLLRSELITPEIIQSLLPWLNSPTENWRVTSTAFFAQLMSDPMLREKKFLKSVLHILEAKAHDMNSIVRQMAVRGLGNLVYGAPDKVKKHKKLLLDVLIRASNDTSKSEVIGESMKALAKVLKELNEKDIGSSFRDLTTQIRTYFDNEDDTLRSLAFVLFGVLARSAKSKWKAYFADQVRQSWVTLLLHLQDPSPKVSMECRATFHLCAPFLGRKRLQAVINEHLGGTAELKPEELQVDICRHLAKENAELQENLYKSTITYFHSSWEEIRAAAAKLVGIILEHTDTQHMKWLDMENLLISLQVLQKDPSLTVQLVAAQVTSDI
ncbi:maestro heat-like repeat-containing protein family member 2B [Emydura macquarii macquarii]|uniref:maestro heat-like repeat-containing protein family member 2B n=1 Tax=Emydura macquarii macquarii TaxID=1129001 RepID=UPI00352AA9B6